MVTGFKQVRGRHVPAQCADNQAMALRRRAALATYDDEMIAAAPRAGVRLYPNPQALA